MNPIIEYPIINILCEICYGFQIDDFEEKIGVNRKIAENLLKKISQAKKSGISEIMISNSEIEIIKNALIEVIKEIEEWEFHTRIGATLEEVKNLTIFL